MAAASTSSTLSSTIAGMTGNVQKAYIQITESRVVSVTEKTIVSAGGGSSLSSLAGKAAGAASGVADAASLALSDASSVTGVIKTTVYDGTRKTFAVKFNPSTLHVSGFGGGQVTKTCYTDKKTEVAMAEGVMHIGMDVKLLFDKTDPADAFMADKLNSSASAIAVNAAKAALSLTGKTNYSVQPEVEAFTAALHNELTRRIAFCWGRMRYEGILESVSARYTMFNTVGQPIRAEVSLSIICVDNDLSQGNMGVWGQYYRNMFAKGSSSLSTLSQKTGNLLNLKL